MLNMLGLVMLIVAGIMLAVIPDWRRSKRAKDDRSQLCDHDKNTVCQRCTERMA